MGPTRELAEFVSRLEYDQLPAEVISKAKECVLDQLGVQLVASPMEWSRIAYSTVRALGGNPESTIVNYGDKTSVPNAAFVNATFGHGCELDDGGYGHPGCVTIPAAIAMGEKVHATGKDVIMAVIAAYEVQSRISVASSQSFMKRGFHKPLFIFGPVAAAGKILKLDTDRLVQAFGIGGSFAGGLRQFSKSGGEVKRLHAGHAACSGILSVLLTERGFTAPPDILEGESGFLRAFAETYSLEPLTKGLGKEFLILQTGFKIYACCGAIPPVMEAVLRMAEANKIGAGDIEHITVKMDSVTADHVGSIYEPHDTAGAQFSLPFTLGLALVKGRVDLGAYLDESLREDPEVLGFARKVVTEADPELSPPFGEHMPGRHDNWTGKVILSLKDGRQLEELSYPCKGFPPGDPLSWQELVQKFEDNAASVMPGKQAQLIVKTVERLETLGDVSELVAHLCV